MHWIDYIVMFLPFFIVIGVAWYSRKYVKGVSGFMTASRCAGRYLICNAAGEAGFGAISAVAIFEYMYKAGFAMTWWQQITIPVGLIITLTGFFIYRYRETRVMTLAQFFEIRYNKSFRILSGIMAFISGMLNFGIFPCVGARFFVNYCGLPQFINLFGAQIPTFAVLMAIFISLALFITLVGGQLTIMVSDCLEGILSGMLYLIVAASLLYLFRWSDIFTALAGAPKGQSMLDPFDTAQAADFNIWYVLAGLFITVFLTGSWQGGHAFRASAANPHEAKMGGILSNWRGFGRTVMISLVAVCAFAYMNHPHYAKQAAEVNQALQAIPELQIQSQMKVPVAVSHMLPIGIKGAFACIILFAMLACDGSYMHSWGSIFIQDVILPFRKKPFSQERHIFLLRLAIAGVGIFAFFFGLLFQQTEYILMFFAVTGAIFAGAGSAILGGLYWRKGTAAAAWASMLAGSGIATSAIILQQMWKTVYPHLIPLLGNGTIYNYVTQHPDKFPINGQYIYLFSCVLSLFTYVVISLLTCKEDFNMDKMLHRGKYAIETDAAHSPPSQKRRFSWSNILGIDREFTLGDKIISVSLFCWSMLWFCVFAAGTAVYLIHPWSIEIWGCYWYIYGIILPFIIGVATTIWFTWGGIRDLKRLFAALKTVKRNAKDDGMVANHHNIDEKLPR